MKKRLLGTLLSLAPMLVLILTLGLTQTAYADDAQKTYQIWVNGNQVTSANMNDVLGDGTVSFSPAKAGDAPTPATLTLNGADIKGGHIDDGDNDAVINIREQCDDFTINLIGNNTIEHSYSKEGTMPGAGIITLNISNITFTGSGTLTVKDGDNGTGFDSRGIRASTGNITIGSGATVNASSSSGYHSYGVNGNKLTVCGELNATAGGSTERSLGVYCRENINVEAGGKLNAAVGNAMTNPKVSCGVGIDSAGNCPMKISGTLIAKGHTHAIAKLINQSAEALQYTVQNGDTVFQSANYDGSNPESVSAGENTSAGAKYVSINFVPVTEVSLNKTSADLTVGGSETLTATVTPEDATSPELEWGSSDPDVATVDKNGKVTAVAAGKATITVTADNGTADKTDDQSATCIVTVSEKSSGQNDTTEASEVVKATVKVTVPKGETFTYDGKAKTGVAAGANYTLSGTVTAANAGTYTAKATLNTDPNCVYEWSDGTTAPKSVTWKIKKATASVAPPKGKTFTYDGKAKTGVAAGTNYTLSGTVTATNAGTYTAKATLNTDPNYAYEWSDGAAAARSITWKIKKAVNPLTIKSKTATVKGSTKGKNGKLKKTKKLVVGKVITFKKKGQGKITYTKVSGKKKIAISKTTGTVTVKKGLKKGTYKVKVKVKAAGNSNYKASAAKTVTITVKVK